MSLRRKIALCWIIIVAAHLVHWIFHPPLVGAIAGWTLLLSRIWISYISRPIAYFALFLFVASVAALMASVQLMIGQKDPTSHLIYLLVAISGACSWMFLITTAISDYLSYKENSRI